MRRFCVVLFVAIVSLFVANAQDFKRVDWGNIELEVTNPSSKYFYPTLFARYTIADTTLTFDDYFYIYYGFSCQDGYKPLLENPLRDELKSVFGKKSTVVNFDKIISLSEEILKTEPFNLRDINVLAFALNSVGRKDEASREMRKIEMLSKVIRSTGNGLTEQTPFYVIYTENCEDLLSFMGLNCTRKMIVSKDVLFIQVGNMPSEFKKFKGYYFNYAEIYKRKPTYLDGIDKPKRKMEFNPRYNPKSDLNVLPKS